MSAEARRARSVTAPAGLEGDKGRDAAAVALLLCPSARRRSTSDAAVVVWVKCLTDREEDREIIVQYPVVVV